jgi:hypothetical protein
MDPALLEGWPVVDLPLAELPSLPFPEIALHQFLTANLALLDQKITRSMTSAAQGHASFSHGEPGPLVQARHTVAQILTLLATPARPGAAGRSDDAVPPAPSPPAQRAPRAKREGSRPSA